MYHIRLCTIKENDKKKIVNLLFQLFEENFYYSDDALSELEEKLDVLGTHIELTEDKFKS